MRHVYHIAFYDGKPSHYRDGKNNIRKIYQTKNVYYSLPTNSNLWGNSYMYTDQHVRKKEGKSDFYKSEIFYWKNLHRKFVEFFLDVNGIPVVEQPTLNEHETEAAFHRYSTKYTLGNFGNFTAKGLRQSLFFDKVADSTGVFRWILWNF